MVKLWIFASFLFSVTCVTSLDWEFAVTSKGSVVYFDANWKSIGTTSHVLDAPLTAIDFDETEDEVYFTEMDGETPSMYGLRVSMDDRGHVSNQVFRQLLKSNSTSPMQGVAYDPVDRIVYWTDSVNKQIFQANVDDPSSAKVMFDFVDAEPKSITVDICRRKLYWSNTNHLKATIERSSLNGSDHEVVISTDLYIPNGIHIDQFTGRLFWVDKKEGERFTVESSMFDGTDRQIIYSGIDHHPLDIAIDRESVYWIDYNTESVWKVAKSAAHIEPLKVYSDRSTLPRGIILRTYFLSAQENNTECQEAITKINEHLNDPHPNHVSRDVTDLTVGKHLRLADALAFNGTCMNRGTFNPKLNKCKCSAGFQGKYCEVPVCHNYCIQGQCELTTTGYAQCICYPGFEGTRCEHDICSGHCLNDGRCELEHNEPVCHCVGPHIGRHCELVDKEKLCQTYCNPGAVLGTLPELCDSCSTDKDAEDDTQLSLSLQTEEYPQSSACLSRPETTFSPKYIFAIVMSVCVCLFLVVVILFLIQRKHKPLRPRIKKTYVVRKNVTPLTCRPSASNNTTEQCEITIEDCCNMNICDTPCFDPHTMKEASKSNGSTRLKEDKTNLLDNME